MSKAEPEMSDFERAEQEMSQMDAEMSKKDTFWAMAPDMTMNVEFDTMSPLADRDMFPVHHMAHQRSELRGMVKSMQMDSDMIKATTIKKNIESTSTTTLTTPTVITTRRVKRKRKRFRTSTSTQKLITTLREEYVTTISVAITEEEKVITLPTISSKDEQLATDQTTIASIVTIERRADSTIVTTLKS